MNTNPFFPISQRLADFFIIKSHLTLTLSFNLSYALIYLLFYHHLAHLDYTYSQFIQLEILVLLIAAWLLHCYAFPPDTSVIYVAISFVILTAIIALLVFASVHAVQFFITKRRTTNVVQISKVLKVVKVQLRNEIPVIIIDSTASLCTEKCDHNITIEICSKPMSGDDSKIANIWGLSNIVIAIVLNVLNGTNKTFMLHWLENNQLRAVLNFVRLQ